MIVTDEGPDGDWTRPGVFEVAPGLHRLPLPLPNDGLRAVNVYVLTGPEGVTLVDAGWAIREAQDRLEAGLGALGAGLGDVRQVLVTHAHRDHYTLGPVVRRAGGARLLLGAAERPTIEALNAPGRPALSAQLTHLRSLGARDLADLIEAAVGAHTPEPGQWDPPDGWLADGQAVDAGGRALAVVETPGHTVGHVVLHDAAAALLLAGDHVLPTITPSIGLEALVPVDPLRAFLGSLARVRALPDARLLPAHGPVTASVHARVDELVAHHGRRLDQTAAALADGLPTAPEVAGALRWTRRERRLDELDPFNQMLAIAETGAHLDLLVSQGRASRDTVDGVRRYAAAG